MGNRQPRYTRTLHRKPVPTIPFRVEFRFYLDPAPSRRASVLERSKPRTGPSELWTGEIRGIVDDEIQTGRPYFWQDGDDPDKSAIGLSTLIGKHPGSEEWLAKIGSAVKKLDNAYASRYDLVKVRNGWAKGSVFRNSEKRAKTLSSGKVKTPKLGNKNKGPKRGGFHDPDGLGATERM